MKEVDINEQAVQFAGRYVNERMKANAGQFERQTVLNCVAHGYFMGYRWRQRVANRWFFKVSNPAPKDFLLKHSNEAAKFYVRVNKLKKLSWEQQAMVKASVSIGFEKGYCEAEA